MKLKNKSRTKINQSGHTVDDTSTFTMDEIKKKTMEKKIIIALPVGVSVTGCIRLNSPTDIGGRHSAATNIIACANTTFNYLKTKRKTKVSNEMYPNTKPEKKLAVVFDRCWPLVHTVRTRMCQRKHNPNNGNERKKNTHKIIKNLSSS